ncbi:hypothetical protein CYLTODRAFT_455037 [Cylindrobasidium torrendii FP15055 ss-10]|uniref:F-box domain-containing protein n=1 Tax=Cylindrobasidium torrendii FP15055 ss-10 TaxID=1314674 RepID=A0A0D7BBD9_9AGAR|nr:hypothetical protein CYLTODRAFT_455037 [Cylindrobasidium torrendii FP15055 ss-10]
MAAGIADLPPEIISIIVKALKYSSPKEDSLSSLALAWRDAWHEIRLLRLKTIQISGIQAHSKINGLLCLLTTYPELSERIKDIVLFFGSSQVQPLRSPGTCHDLVELLSMAKNARYLSLDGSGISQVLLAMDASSPQIHHVRVAFQNSSFKSLRIRYTHAATGLLDFIALFPNMKELDLESTANVSPSFFANREHSLPQFDRLLSLTVPYTSPAERQLLDFIAQESVFPNIQNFTFGRYSNRDVFPVLKQLLSSWSTSLVMLDMFYSFQMKVKGPFLKLPSTLSIIKLRIPLRSSEWLAYNEFWAETLKQHTSFAEIHVQVTYPKFIVDAIEGANMDRSIAPFDRALVERAEYLDWEDAPLRIRPRPRDAPKIAATYQWLFETVFPLTSERFFAGMPVPMPGDVHTNTIATRRHMIACDVLLFGGLEE